METVRLDREISQTTAPSGVIVLSERVPSVRSVAVGIWVRSASAHEPRPKMGVSHLLEHMVFKGTERRTAQQIALALEVRGGDRKSTRLNSSHSQISYAVFCLKKKKRQRQ